MSGDTGDKRGAVAPAELRPRGVVLEKPPPQGAQPPTPQSSRAAPTKCTGKGGTCAWPCGTPLSAVAAPPPRPRSPSCGQSRAVSGGTAALGGAPRGARQRDGTLTGFSRAPSAEPHTSPRVPAAFAAAPPPPPAAAAAPSPPPCPAPAPLRGEGAPQNLSHPAGHRPRGVGGQVSTPGWGPGGRTDGRTLQSRVPAGQLSPLAPQRQRLVPQRRGVGLQPGLGTGDTAAWEWGGRHRPSSSAAARPPRCPQSNPRCSR